jgi:4-hydroxybenzoate polyprenyltransferase
MDYLPLSLSLFGSSNLADCQDIQEDQINKIETFPIKYGLQTAIKVSMASLALSGLLFGLSPNYLDRPVINSIVELQNAGTSLIPFFLINNTLSDIGITI